MFTLEVICILVVCNNRDKSWCPYGEKNCRCDCHEPKELAEGKDDVRFSCTDKNYKDRNCSLIEYEKYKMIKKLLYSGHKKTEIKALFMLIQKGVTPEEYDYYYKKVNN